MISFELVACVGAGPRNAPCIRRERIGRVTLQEIGNFIGREPVFFLAAAATIALVAGLLLGLMSRPSDRHELAALVAEADRLETQNREQARLISKLRVDQRGLGNLTRFLPAMIRDLNRSDIDPRRVPELLISLVDAVFEPRQITLYQVRSPGEPSERGIELYLTGQRGLPESETIPRRIRAGEGRIGWVAENRVEMLADDWSDFTRTDGQIVPENHAALKLDLVGPIVHNESGRDRLFGVLAIGSPSIRPRDEKLMLQMITNLAAIAIVNARNYRRLRELANRDGLTGLFNKRYFLRERVGEMIHQAEREARRLGVFLFDIDYFKTYNDTNGHVAGDDVLRAVAGVLNESLRPSDCACRYGGEEFVVVMPESRPGEALHTAERIRAAMESHPFALRESQPGGRLTISGGVAVFPLDGASSVELLQHADEALYRAKRQGRNRVLPYRGLAMGEHEETGDSPRSPQSTHSS